MIHDYEIIGFLYMCLSIVVSVLMTEQKFYAVQFRTGPFEEWNVWDCAKHVVDNVYVAKRLKEEFEKKRDKFDYIGPWLCKGSEYRLVSLKVGEVIE